MFIGISGYKCNKCGEIHDGIMLNLLKDRPVICEKCLSEVFGMKSTWVYEDKKKYGEILRKTHGKGD